MLSPGVGGDVLYWYTRLACANFLPTLGGSRYPVCEPFLTQQEGICKKKVEEKNGCLHISFFYFLQPVFGQVCMDQPEYCFSTFLGVPRKLFSSKLNFQGS